MRTEADVQWEQIRDIVDWDNDPDLRDALEAKLEQAIEEGQELYPKNSLRNEKKAEGFRRALMKTLLHEAWEKYRAELDVALLPSERRIQYAVKRWRKKVQQVRGELAHV